MRTDVCLLSGRISKRPIYGLRVVAVKLINATA